MARGERSDAASENLVPGFLRVPHSPTTLSLYRLGLLISNSSLVTSKSWPIASIDLYSGLYIRQLPESIKFPIPTSISELRSPRTSQTRLAFHAPSHRRGETTRIYWLVPRIEYRRRPQRICTSKSPQIAHPIFRSWRALVGLHSEFTDYNVKLKVSVLLQTKKYSKNLRWGILFSSFYFFIFFISLRLGLGTWDGDAFLSCNISYFCSEIKRHKTHN